MSETMLFAFDAWRGYLEADAELVSIREKVEAMPLARSKVCGGLVLSPQFGRCFSIASRRGRCFAWNARIRCVREALVVRSIRVSTAMNQSVRLASGMPGGAPIFATGL